MLGGSVSHQARTQAYLLAAGLVEFPFFFPSFSLSILLRPNGEQVSAIYIRDSTFVF
jgi:hypothetical protein